VKKHSSLLRDKISETDKSFFKIAAICQCHAWYICLYHTWCGQISCTVFTYFLIKNLSGAPLNMGTLTSQLAAQIKISV
jgi:hypothetical protein